MAGNRRHLAPVGLGRIGGSEEEKDFRLQGIGVLKFIDENMREALLETATDILVAPDQIARLKKQIEKIETSGARFQLLVLAHRAHELPLKRRCEIGVGIETKAVKMGTKCVDRGNQLRSGDTLSISGSAAMPRS